MGANGHAKIDLEEAQQLLDVGTPVLRIAHLYEVSPQAIYRLIKRGRLTRHTPQAAPAA